MQTNEPKDDTLPEVEGDSKQDESNATASAGTPGAPDQDVATGVPETADAAEGSNGVTAADEAVVDEVSIALPSSFI